MKSTIYSVVPVLAGLPFVIIGIFGVWMNGPHPLLVGFALLGLFSIFVGFYHFTFKIEFHEGEFVVHPGKKKYSMDDVFSWRSYEDTDCEVGYRRHIELRFDRWYRRYLILEDQVTPEVFDLILATLNNKKSRK